MICGGQQKDESTFLFPESVLETPRDEVMTVLKESWY